MPLMPHHNHLCLTEGGLEIIISKLNRIKSAIELCVYAFSNFYRTAINEYKRKARELLTSEEGIKRRGRRCIEPEAVFGQMKFNMAYRRFRHFGKDKVTMDFAFFAIAFNIKKMCSKIAKQAKNGGNTPHFGLILLVCGILPPENRMFWQNPQKSVA